MIRILILKNYAVILKVRGEKDMNWDQIKSRWIQLRGKAKEKWGKLTDEDLDLIDGKRDRLVEKLQEKYRRSRYVTEREIDKWIDGL